MRAGDIQDSGGASRDEGTEGWCVLYLKDEPNASVENTEKC